jgi:hypothetical protein
MSLAFSERFLCYFSLAKYCFPIKNSPLEKRLKLPCFPWNLTNIACIGQAGGVAPASGDSALKVLFYTLAFVHQIPRLPVTLSWRFLG